MKTLLLSELGKIVTGKTPKTSREDFFGGATPFVTPSDMGQQRTISKTARTLSNDGVFSVKNSVIPAGAVMVSCIGSDMGKTYLAGTRSVTNQQINTLIVSEGSASPLFIYYNLFGRRTEIRDKAAGAAQPILNKTEFGKIAVDLPSIKEQHDIAAILGALDDKIELNRKTAATLEEMARGLYRSWFVDFDPVHARSQGLPPAHMPPTTAALFPDSFGEDGLPEGWSAGTMADLIEFNPKERLAKGSETPYLDMKALPTSGMITDAPILRAFTSGMKFRDNDTLLARITPCLENGKTGMVCDLGEDVVGWGSTEFIVMRPKNGVPASLPYCVARDPSFRDEAISTMTGSSGRQRADAERISMVFAAVPPKQILDTFTEQSMPMIQRIQSIGTENQTLATLRDTLIPRLMSGELRVGDARDQIKEAT